MAFSNDFSEYSKPAPLIPDTTVAFVGDDFSSLLLEYVFRVARPDPSELDFFFDQTHCDLLIVTPIAGNPRASKWPNFLSESDFSDYPNYKLLLEKARSHKIPTIFWLTSDDYPDNLVPVVDRSFNGAMVSNLNQMPAFKDASVPTVCVPLLPALDMVKDTELNSANDGRTGISFQGFSIFGDRVSLGKNHSTFFDALSWTYLDALSNPRANTSTYPSTFRWGMRRLISKLGNSRGSLVGLKAGTGAPPLFEFVLGVLSGCYPVVVSENPSATKSLNPMPAIFKSKPIEVVAKPLLSSFEPRWAGWHWRDAILNGAMTEKLITALTQMGFLPSDCIPRKFLYLDLKDQIDGKDDLLAFLSEDLGNAYVDIVLKCEDRTWLRTRTGHNDVLTQVDSEFLDQIRRSEHFFTLCLPNLDADAVRVASHLIAYSRQQNWTIPCFEGSDLTGFAALSTNNVY